MNDTLCPHRNICLYSRDTQVCKAEYKRCELYYRFKPLELDLTLRREAEQDLELGLGAVDEARFKLLGDGV